MASDEVTEPQACMPCRGTGQVISNLGGTTTKVPCPWCDGGGVRLTGVDAQAGWPENVPEAQAEPDAETTEPDAETTEPDAAA
jgi:hypothetical protein